jgi:hypothetical protein
MSQIPSCKTHKLPQGAMGPCLVCKRPPPKDLVEVDHPMRARIVANDDPVEGLFDARARAAGNDR